MTKQSILSILGIVAGVVMAIDDIKHGSYIWAGFWFIMLVVHFLILVGEIESKEIIV